MELNGVERVLLLRALPNEFAEFSTTKIVHDMRQALAFDEDEYEAIEGQVVEDGGFRFNPGKALEYVTDIPIGRKAQDEAEKAIRKLLKDGKFTEGHMSLAEKLGIE